MLEGGEKSRGGCETVKLVRKGTTPGWKGSGPIKNAEGKKMAISTPTPPWGVSPAELKGRGG